MLKDFAEKIRDKILISSIIGQKISLKSKGKEFLGLCPFHEERTPSFTVNDQKMFYHCFGCGAHGDVIKFVSETERLSYIDTLKYLASIVGMRLPDKFQEERNDKFDILYEIINEANKWFSGQLTSSSAQIARDYLKSRNISNEMVERFKIGYAPNDNDRLIHYLKNKGYSIENIKEAGLASINNRGNYYDNFRGRIIFPIFDLKNRVIAFGGRTLFNAPSKYYNSPETSIFKKGTHLYAENFARKSKTHNKVVIVEGYLDAITLYMHGIDYAVASLGTSITEQNIINLWKISNEPIICLDGDTAGFKAMIRLTETCLPLIKAGYSFKFARLPDKKDPDEILNLYGPDYFNKIIDNAFPLSELIFAEKLSLINKNSPEGRASLLSSLKSVTQLIKDSAVKESYNSFFRQKVYELDRNKTLKIKNDLRNNLSPINLNTKTRLEFNILAIILSNLKTIGDHDIANYLFTITFEHEISREIQKTINELMVSNCDINSIFDIEDSNLVKSINFILDKSSGFIDTKDRDISIEILKEKIFLYVKKIERENLLMEYNRLMKQMSEESIIKAKNIKEELFCIDKKIIDIEENLQTSIRNA